MSTDSLSVSLTLPLPGVSEQAHGYVACRQAADEALTELVAQLYQQHAKAICVYIHSLVGEWVMAHDLTQEAFLQLHRSRARLPQVENQRAWLYGVASYVAFNALKRQRRFAWLPWHTAENEAQLTAPNMEQEVAGRAAVEKALARLSPEYRAPLLSQRRPERARGGGGIGTQRGRGQDPAAPCAASYFARAMASRRSKAQ